MNQLKLVALDGDDLAVVSTHLQDAIVSVADIIWQQGHKRVILALSRFDWEAAERGSAPFQRRASVLRFDRVSAFKSRNVQPDERALVLNLLSIEFDESDPPAGAVILTFSGGVALRLEVECLEAELADLGPAWTTEVRPDHPVDPPERRG